MRVIAPIRGNYQHGSGAIGAFRGGGTRKHNGVDIACIKGTTVISPVAGKLTKIGFPYDLKNVSKGYLRYVEVTTEKKNRHRFFYITPKVAVGDLIAIGDVLGVTQGLTSIYIGITDHFHYEVIDPWGGFIDPTQWVTSGKYET